jgi:hypothetical protein
LRSMTRYTTMGTIRTASAVRTSLLVILFWCGVEAEA